METKKKSLTAAAYTVGLVYIKPLEMHAITAMLDEEHNPVTLQHGDINKYTLGKIGNHNVVIVGPSRGTQGKATIADLVGRIHLTFRNMTVGLLVGIGGGVPHVEDHDVRLGDVVVGAPETGPAVVQYDLGKETPNGFEYSTLRTLNKPPLQLLQVVTAVEDKIMRQRKSDKSFFVTHLHRFEEFPSMVDEYKRPFTADRLFLATYPHEEGTECKMHDKRFEKERPARNPPDKVKVHYSTILSGDRVMRFEVIRDKLSADFNNALCFEMEAAGLMDTFPCLVVRGICDYSDSHKSKDWQKYSAGTAAAYAREILLNMEKRTIKDLEDLEKLRREKDSGDVQGQKGGVSGGGSNQVFSGNTISGGNNSGFFGNNSGNGQMSWGMSGG